MKRGSVERVLSLPRRIPFLGVAAEHAAVADRFAHKIIRILAGVSSARGS